ncbi:MAG: hypothetical protein H6Q36_1247 [Chloroflexi bacterium]|nr:hypothetical protein [Chloroflexota bacterium]
MTPIAVAAAAVVVLGAVLGTGARSARVATLGLTMALLFSPFVADPLPDTLALATRLVGGTLAGYLLLVTSRRAVAPVGSPLGSLALLAAAGAAAVAGFQPSILGLARQGPEEAMAAGLACLILALPAVVAARDTFRLGASLVVALTGILLVRAALVGSPSGAEEVAITFAIATLGGAVAFLGAVTSAAGGTLSLDDVGARPDGARPAAPPAGVPR